MVKNKKNVIHLNKVIKKKKLIRDRIKKKYDKLKQKFKFFHIYKIENYNNETINDIKQKYKDF